MKIDTSNNFNKLANAMLGIQFLFTLLVALFTANQLPSGFKIITFAIPIFMLLILLLVSFRPEVGKAIYLLFVVFGFLLELVEINQGNISNSIGRADLYAFLFGPTFSVLIIIFWRINVTSSIVKEE